MICPNCGYKANDNDKFCMFCATRLITDEEYAAMAAAAEHAAETAEAGAEAVEQAAEDAVNDAAAAVESAFDEAVNDMDKAVDGAEKAVDEAVSDIDKAVDNAEAALDDAFNEVDEAVETAVSEAEEAVDEVKAEAVEAVEDAAEEAEKAAEEVKEELHEAAEAVVPAVPVTAAEPVVAECCRATEKPLTTWGYLWRILLFSVPIFGMIPLFVMAFSSGINKNSRGLARAVLIILLVLFILACAGVIFALIAYGPDAITAYLNKLYLALIDR